MKRAIRWLAFVLVAALALSATACGGKGNKDAVSIFSRPTVEKTEGKRKDWIDVDSFACYYGSLTGDAEENPVLGGDPVSAVDALKTFDVAIVHSSSLRSAENGKEIVRQLRDSGTYVIAYISIGEEYTLSVGDGLGENGYASYYLYENGMPKINPSWGSYFVDAGNPVWQAKVLAEAADILDFGVDGLFLDTVDTVDVAYDTLGGMVDLVRLLDETYPQAKLVPNRGFTVYPYISQYVDGIMFESFSTTYDETSGFFVDRDADDYDYNTSIACNVINRARRYDYMPVFCLDYVNSQEYSYMPQAIMNAVWEYDFISYVTYARDLGVCPVPNVRPTSERGKLALSKLSEDAGDVSSNGDTSAANLAYAGNALCTVTVDSVFTGYSAKPINDGFYATRENHNQLNWANESWASENNTAKDHWIQFTFADVQQINSVTVYWGVDGTGSNPTIYSPREAYVQAWIDGAWQTVGDVYNWKSASGEFSVQQQSTAFTFDTVATDRIRVFQPKNMGEGTRDRYDGVTTNFSGIMWVSEVEIH